MITEITIKFISHKSHGENQLLWETIVNILRWFGATDWEIMP